MCHHQVRKNPNKVTCSFEISRSFVWNVGMRSRCKWSFTLSDHLQYLLWYFKPDKIRTLPHNHNRSLMHLMAISILGEFGLVVTHANGFLLTFVMLHNPLTEYCQIFFHRNCNLLWSTWHLPQKFDVIIEHVGAIVSDLKCSKALNPCYMYVLFRLELMKTYFPTVQKQ